VRQKSIIPILTWKATSVSIFSGIADFLENIHPDRPDFQFKIEMSVFIKKSTDTGTGIIYKKKILFKNQQCFQISRISVHFHYPVSGRISGKSNLVFSRISFIKKGRIKQPDTRCIPSFYSDDKQC
jgi:hypothetical protein